MTWTKVSCDSQLYSEHQTVYALRVKYNPQSKVYSPKGKGHVAGKPHLAKTCFSWHVNKYQ